MKKGSSLKEKFKNLFQKAGEEGETTKKTLIFILDIALNIVIILGLVFIIRTYLISPFQVYGPSMCDTLNNINGQCQREYGEYIIVNKAIYQNFLGWQVGKPQRGDIIVFHPPQSNTEFFIKRVIGLPGETVKLNNGDVYIYNQEHKDGVKLDEPYLNAVNKDNTRPYPNEPSVFQVPQNQYFVLGDNRTQSSDSRSCFKESSLSPDCGTNGVTSFLSMNHIEGKAWVVLWPLNKITLLQNPEYNF